MPFFLRKLNRRVAHTVLSACSNQRVLFLVEKMTRWQAQRWKASRPLSKSAPQVNSDSAFVETTAVEHGREPDKSKAENDNRTDEH